MTNEEKADIIRACTEHVLTLLPSVIIHLIDSISTLKEVSNKFYQENSDLVQHKDIVGKVIEQLEAKFPGRTVQEIANMAAGETRNLLSQQIKASTSQPLTRDSLNKVLGNL